MLLDTKLYNIVLPVTLVTSVLWGNDGVSCLETTCAAQTYAAERHATVTSRTSSLLASFASQYYSCKTCYATNHEAYVLLYNDGLGAFGSIFGGAAAANIKIVIKRNPSTMNRPIRLCLVSTSAADYDIEVATDVAMCDIRLIEFTQSHDPNIRVHYTNGTDIDIKIIQERGPEIRAVIDATESFNNLYNAYLKDDYPFFTAFDEDYLVKEWQLTVGVSDSCQPNSSPLSIAGPCVPNTEIVLAEGPGVMRCTIPPTNCTAPMPAVVPDNNVVPDNIGITTEFSTKEDPLGNDESTNLPTSTTKSTPKSTPNTLLITTLSISASIGFIILIVVPTIILIRYIIRKSQINNKKDSEENEYAYIDDDVYISSGQLDDGGYLNRERKKESNINIYDYPNRVPVIGEDGYQNGKKENDESECESGIELDKHEDGYGNGQGPENNGSECQNGIEVDRNEKGYRNGEGSENNEYATGCENGIELYKNEKGYRNGEGSENNENDSNLHDPKMYISSGQSSGGYLTPIKNGIGPNSDESEMSISSGYVNNGFMAPIELHNIPVNDKPNGYLAVINDAEIKKGPPPKPH